MTHSKEKLIKAIQQNGYWTSEQEIDDNLSKCSSKTKQTDQLKQQINARKKILFQKVSNKLLFQFSFKGEKFSVDRLRMNLLELIDVHIGEEENNKFDITTLAKNPMSIIKKL